MSKSPTIHKPLPVPGYTPVSQESLEAITQNKHLEEVVLRRLDELRFDPEVDARWLAIAKTDIETGFMALNRAIYKPQRVKLPDDEGAD